MFTYSLKKLPLAILAVFHCSSVLANDVIEQTDKLEASTPALNNETLIPQKSWTGATIELSSLLLLGGGLYSASSESMKDDFDYELEGNAAQYFYDRLATNETWKYDDNNLGMNWGHAYAGALYH